MKRKKPESSKAVRGSDVDRLYKAFLRVLMEHWKRIKADINQKIDSAYSVLHVKSANIEIKIAPKGSAHASPLAQEFVFGIEAIIDRTRSEIRYNYGLDDAGDWRIESMGTYEAIKSAALDLCDSTVADMEAATGRKIEDLIGEVRQDILAGQKAGITRGQLSNKIAQYFAETARWKARRIARTEASRGVNYGYIVSTEHEEWVVGYEWLMTSDACELCQRVGTVDGRPRRWRTPQAPQSRWAGSARPPAPGG